VMTVGPPLWSRCWAVVALGLYIGGLGAKLSTPSLSPHHAAPSSLPGSPFLPSFPDRPSRYRSVHMGPEPGGLGRCNAVLCHRAMLSTTREPPPRPPLQLFVINLSSGSPSTRRSSWSHVVTSAGEPLPPSGQASP
jgi:hypothetical protein